MPFSDQRGIFKNSDVLSYEYLPEILPHRENQIKFLATTISGLERQMPRNVFIFGPPGIGKTASVKFVFREFEDSFPNVKTFYINCWTHGTSVSIFSKLTEDLNVTGVNAKRRGLGKDEVIRKFEEALEKSKKNILICLDEVDQLIYKDSGALYDLLRMDKFQNKIGLIFLSNDPHVFAKLESRISSSLAINELEFKPYTIDEMKNILQKRIEHAFNSVQTGVTILAANHAIRKGGDVRAGLEVLRKAGMLAENMGDGKLKIGHVKEILKRATEVKPKILSEKINDYEKLILKIVKSDGKISYGEIYKKFLEKSGSQISERMFRNHFKHLKSTGMIKINEKKIGGKRIVSKT